MFGGLGAVSGVDGSGFISSTHTFIWYDSEALLPGCLSAGSLLYWRYTSLRMSLGTSVPKTQPVSPGLTAACGVVVHWNPVMMSSVSM